MKPLTYALITPSWHVHLVKRNDVWWEMICPKTLDKANFNTLEEALWFVVSWRGKGPCDWNALRKQLFKDEQIGDEDGF